jgi:acyl dehydratase
MRFEDVELGDDLPDTQPDISLARVRQFVEATFGTGERFTNHDFARQEGFPGALVPGIMSQALLSSMIHAWAPGARIVKLDTVFRTPLVVDTQPRCSGAVTDTDPESRTVEVDLTIVTAEGATSVLGTATVELD